MNGIPYFILRSAYSTCRPVTPRGQSRIRYSLPSPGFSASGIHLASATGKPLGFLWIHVPGFIKWATKKSRFGVLFSCADFPRRLVKFCSGGRVNPTTQQEQHHTTHDTTRTTPNRDLSLPRGCPRVKRALQLLSKRLGLTRGRRRLSYEGAASPRRLGEEALLKRTYLHPGMCARRKTGHTRTHNQNTQQEQHHTTHDTTRTANNTTNDHTKNHPRT